MTNSFPPDLQGPVEGGCENTEQVNTLQEDMDRMLRDMARLHEDPYVGATFDGTFALKNGTKIINENGNPGTMTFPGDGGITINQGPQTTINIIQAPTPEPLLPGTIPLAAAVSIGAFMDGGGVTIRNDTRVDSQIVPFNIDVKQIAITTNGDGSEGDDAVLEIYYSAFPDWPPDLTPGTSPDYLTTVLVDNATKGLWNYTPPTLIGGGTFIFVAPLGSTGSITHLTVSVLAVRP